MARKRLTDAEKAEIRARREQMVVNAERTRRLAEKAQAELDAKNAAKRD
jgi:hypothetical protein